MWRKRATSAPAFRQPAPYNPLSGQHAPIGRSFPYSRIAMMQVAEEDTHDNYVVCRGFDPECGRFLNTVNVAKPYGIRGTNPYVVGQVFAAAKPRTALGDTPGKAETTVGHPADLDEAVMILTDDDGNPIAWLDIGTAEVGTPVLSGYITPIEETTQNVVTAISASKHLSAKTIGIYDGTAEDIQVTILEAAAFDDPFLSVNCSGMWLFHVKIGMGTTNMTIPVLTGTVDGGACSVVLDSGNFPRIQLSVVLYWQAAAGGAWHVVAAAQGTSFGYCATTAGGAAITVVGLANLDAGDKVKLVITAANAGGALDTETVAVTGTVVIEKLR